MDIQSVNLNINNIDLIDTIMSEHDRKNGASPEEAENKVKAFIEQFRKTQEPQARIAKETNSVIVGYVLSKIVEGDKKIIEEYIKPGYDNPTLGVKEMLER